MLQKVYFISDRVNLPSACPLIVHTTPRRRPSQYLSPTPTGEGYDDSIPPLGCDCQMVAVI